MQSCDWTLDEIERWLGGADRLGRGYLAWDARNGADGEIQWDEKTAEFSLVSKDPGPYTTHLPINNWGELQTAARILGREWVIEGVPTGA